MMMKRSFIIMLACSLALAFAGCSKEYDDRTLSERLKKLEEEMKALQTQVSYMNSQIDGVSMTIAEWKKGGFVEKIQPIDGGYTITFVGGKVVTLLNGKDGADGKNGKNGQDGHTPVITIGPNGNWYIDGKDTGKPSRGAQGDPGGQGDPGHTPELSIGSNGNWFIDGVDTGFPAVGKDGKDGEDGEDGKDGENGADGEDGVSPTIVSQDGEFYWALDGELILVDGKPVPATTVPAFSINEEGHLIMTIAGQQMDLGIVRGASGDSMLKNVEVTDDDVVFTLSDNSTFSIPFAKSFRLIVDQTLVEAIDGQVVSLKYEVVNADAGTTVDAFANGFYSAEVDETERVIKVTVPDPFQPGQVLVWAQNDKGLSSIVKLSFSLGAELKVITEDIDQIVGDAGLFDVQVTCNVPVEVEEPEVDWLKVKEVKGATYTITFELTQNDTEQIRTTEVNILRADTKKVVQTITVGQLAYIIPGRFVIDFNEQGYTALQPLSTLTVEDITILFSQGSGTEVPVYTPSYASIRMHGGNTLTVEAGKPIREIDFVMGEYDGNTSIVPDTGTMDQNKLIWTKGSTTSRVVFSFSDIRRISQLIVFLEV